MEYKIGDEVVLRDDIKVGNSYGDVYVSKELQSAIGGSIEILEKRSGFPKSYYVANGNSFNCISETMINHEKTAELKKQSISSQLNSKLSELFNDNKPINIKLTDKNQLLDHYQQELETMKYRADAIEPDHYRKGLDDLYESAYRTRPFNEYRAIMEFVAERYIKRDKENRVEDLEKAIYTIERLKEKELEQGEETT